MATEIAEKSLVLSTPRSFEAPHHGTSTYEYIRITL